MGIFQTKKEKDFEFFVRNIGKLSPTEFVGLAKVMGIPTLRGLDEAGISIEDFKDKADWEKREIVNKLTIPTDQVLEQMLDKFLGFSKKARNTVIQLIKDVQRGK